MSAVRRTHSSKCLLLVDGVDHFSGAISDSDGAFPQRIDVFTRARIPPDSIAVASVSLAQNVDDLLSLCPEIDSVIYVGEWPAVESTDAWFDEPADSSAAYGDDSLQSIYSKIWNHYHQHHEQSHLEQFHLRIQQLVSEGHSLKFRVVSVATRPDVINGVLTLFNDRGIFVKQLLSTAIVNSYHTTPLSKTGVVHLQIGWFHSELVLSDDNMIRSIESLPIGMSHFGHDVSIGLGCSVPDAIQVIRSHGWASLSRGAAEGNGFLDQPSRHRYKSIVEARLQEFLRMIVRRLHCMQPSHLRLALTIGGQEAPGLHELIRLVVGGDSLACAFQPDFSPRFLDGSEKVFTRPAVQHDLASALRYVSDQRASAERLRETLTKFSTIRSRQVPSTLGWLKELL